MEEIEKEIVIEEFPELPDEIIKAINERKFVVFIGAGISRLIGCVSWQELARKLIDKCSVEKDDKGKPLLNYREKELLLQVGDNKKIITIASNLLKEEKFYEVMEKELIFSDETIKEKNIYSDIIELKGVCITTNADNALNKYFENGKNIKCMDIDFDADDINPLYLYQIHGRVEKRNSLIFTVDQYIKKYSNSDENKNFIKFLQTLFSEYTILFLGYGISEFELLDYIITKTSSKNKHYLLNGYFKDEKKLLEYDKFYYDKLGIEIIPYSKDNYGYKQQEKIIEKWKEEVYLKTNIINKNFEEMNNFFNEDNNYILLDKNLKNLDYRNKFFKKLLEREMISKELAYHILSKNILKSKEFLKENWLELEVVYKLVINNIETKFVKSNSLLINEIDKIENKMIEENIFNTQTSNLILGLVIVLRKELLDIDLIYFSREMSEKQRQIIFFRNIFKEIVPFLIKSKQALKLEQVFIKLLEYNTNHYMRELKWKNDILYAQIFSEYSEEIFNLCSLKLVNKIVEILKKEAIKKENKYIFSKYNIENINDKKIETSLGINLLVKLLYKGLKVKINEGEELLEELLTSNIEILERIALKIISKDKGLRYILFKQRNINKFFNNCYRELEEYLKNNEDIFTSEEIEYLVDEIENSFNGFDEESIKALYRKSWLSMLLKTENKRVKMLYDKYDKINSNNSLSFIDDYNIKTGWQQSKYISPMNKNEIIVCLKENKLEELKKILTSYENQRDEFFEEIKSKEGLLEELKEATVQEVNLVIKNLKSLTNIDEEYIYYIFEGICKNEKINLKDIDILLLFISQLLKRDIWNEKESYLRVKSKIADVLNFIFRNLKDKKNIEKRLLKLFQINKIILEKLPIEISKEEDIILFGLNSKKGRYLEILLRINLKLKEIDSEKLLEVLEFTRNYLETKFEEKDDNINYIVGVYIRQLLYLDKDWLKNKKKLFFNIEDKLSFWKIMGAYLLGNSNLYKDLYEFMKEWYKTATQLLGSGGLKYESRLVEHLIIGYIYYGDKLIYNLMEICSEELLEKIIRFISYYDEKIDNNKLKSIWKRILRVGKSESNIPMLTFKFMDKIKNINEETLKLIDLIVEKQDKGINLDNEIYLDWLDEKLEENKVNKEELKGYYKIIKKLGENKILFSNFLDKLTLEKLIKILEENGLNPQATTLKDIYLNILI